MSSKVCFKCLQCKPLEAFYKHSAMTDQRLNKCIECAKLDVAKHRLQNIERIREYDRLRARQAHRVQMRKNVMSRRAEMYPHRKRANSATSNALRNGQLVPLPCWTCGNLKTEAHHPDYDQPLQVVWLCVSHHRQLHAHARLWAEGKTPTVVMEPF